MDIKGLFDGIMKRISQFADEIAEQRLQGKMLETGRGPQNGGKNAENFEAKEKRGVTVSRKWSDRVGITEHDVSEAFSNVESFWKDLFPVERNRLQVEKVEIRETGIDMELKTNGLITLITELAGFSLRGKRTEGKPMKRTPTITVAENGNLQIHIPMLIRRMRGRKQVIAPQAQDGEIPEGADTVQTAVVQALARAFSWAEILECGQVKSISELACNLEVDGYYVTRILKLTTLAPDIAEAIINGDEPDGLSLAKLPGLSQRTGESSADFSGLKIIVHDWAPNPEDLLAVR